ncbi:hypothetical protein GCM10023187_33720 [Nibrella viscosa]|uniref:PNPLA domain-containing protein n=1 Tax=Nibrella viscosa TaxID=1084524 RepID=A0ABP8KL30_9BACT
MENIAPQRQNRLFKLLANSYNYLKSQYYRHWQEPLSRSFFAEIGNLLKTLFSILFLHPYLKVAILMVQTLWLIILLLFLTYLPLSSMDQATDVFSVVAEGENLWWTLGAHISVFVFALTVWFSCRMLFIFFDLGKIKERVYTEEAISKQQEHALQGLMRWIPPLLGLLPFFIFMGSLSGHSGSGIQIAVVVLLIGGYFIVLSQNTRFMKDLELDTGPVDEQPAETMIQVPGKEKKDYLSLQKHTFGQLRVRYRLLTYVMYLFCFLLFVVCAIFPVNLWFSRLIGVVAGVFLAMSMWVFLAHALLLLDHQYKAPIAVLIVGIILFFWNTNNHQIRTVRDPYFLKSDELLIPNHFVKWIEQREDSINAWVKDAKDKGHTQTYPIYIVAAEGGGLRAAYWTGAILGELSKRIPGFYNRVYALSTVSGGSVGAAIYTKLYADSLSYQQSTQTPSRVSGTVYAKATGILSQDYLSPLTMAFLVPDMVQKLLPVSIGSFDRAQYIEKALSKAYTDTVSRFLPVAPAPGGAVKAGFFSAFLSRFASDDRVSPYSLDSSFLSIWRKDKLYTVPSLFMNCTRVEDGAKVVLSNLLIKGNAFQGVNSQEVIDLQEKIHKHIPIGTAAFMSARFPLVTPPATIQSTKSDRPDWFNVVDGGYIDNSGLETAIAILTSISEAPGCIDRVYANGDQAKANQIRALLSKVEVHLVLIKNSEQNDDDLSPVRGLYEIKTPLLAFFNSWDRHIGSKLNITRQHLRLAATQILPKDSVSIKVDSTLVLFDLDRKQELVPLGWFLSKRAQRCMRIQADSLPNTNAYRQRINFNLRHIASARPATK